MTTISRELLNISHSIDYLDQIVEAIIGKIDVTHLARKQVSNIALHLRFSYDVATDKYHFFFFDKFKNDFIVGSYAEFKHICFQFKYLLRLNFYNDTFDSALSEIKYYAKTYCKFSSYELEDASVA